MNNLDVRKLIKVMKAALTTVFLLVGLQACSVRDFEQFSCHFVNKRYESNQERKKQKQSEVIPEIPSTNEVNEPKTYEKNCERNSGIRL